jgi:hypothetical protein
MKMIIAWLNSRCGGSAWLTQKDLLRVQEISQWKLEVKVDEEGERTLIKAVRVDPKARDYAKPLKLPGAPSGSPGPHA